MASMSDFISDLIHLADNEKLNNAIEDKKERFIMWKIINNYCLYTPYPRRKCF